MADLSSPAEPGTGMRSLWDPLGEQTWSMPCCAMGEGCDGEPYYDNLGNLYNEGGVVSLDYVTSTVGMMGARMNGGELVVSHSLLSNNIGNGLNVNGGT